MQIQMQRPPNPVSSPPRSFESRLSRLKAWTLIPVTSIPLLAWAVIAEACGVSDYTSRQMTSAILYAAMLGWWLVLAAPRPYSVRATMRRPLDRAGYGLVLRASLGVLCLGFLAVLGRQSGDLLRAASSGATATIRLTLTDDDPANLIALAFSVVVAPLVEELVFRATLFRAWRVRWSPVVALLVSSVLFGAGHKFAVNSFLAGVTFALLYTRTGSLWANVLCHSLNNAAWAVVGGLHYFWAAPQLDLKGPVDYGALALTVLIGTGVWLHFVIKSWRTLGAPLSPDSPPATSSVPSPPIPSEALRFGRRLS